VKQVVGVDLDEVLGHFLPQFINYHNQQYDTSFKLGDFFSYTFSKVMGETEVEVNKRVNDFFKSTFFDEIKPVPGSIETLHRHLDHFDFVVITSRQSFLEEKTRIWLRQHFGDTIRDVLFANHWNNCGKAFRKSELCEKVNATIFIDDNFDYASDVSSVCQHVLLFDLEGSYGWGKHENNNNHSLPDRVKRVCSWKQIDEYLSQIKCENRNL